MEERGELKPGDILSFLRAQLSSSMNLRAFKSRFREKLHFFAPGGFNSPLSSIISPSVKPPFSALANVKMFFQIAASLIRATPDWGR